MELHEKIRNRFTVIVLFAILAGCTASEWKIETIDHANANLGIEPVTVTASFCPRSAGNIHDFYSEGDYWWQNPDDPEGPYIRRDGESNPDNFADHRHAMVSMSIIVTSLQPGL